MAHDLRIDNGRVRLLATACTVFGFAPIGMEQDENKKTPPMACAHYSGTRMSRL